VWLGAGDALDRLAAYRAAFERAYVEATERHYAPLAAAQLARLGPLAYLAWAAARLDDEQLRARRYLHLAPDCNSLQLVGTPHQSVSRL